jgi:2-polyprenyl-3-methyl-5-hydroxy-6-metoxy-1,4-benzoquinol methylase
MTPRCPACLGDNTKFNFSVSATEAAQLLVIREGPYRERHDALVALIRKKWDGDSCEIRTCADCEFGFASPFVGGDEEFYNLAYPTVRYPAMKWEFAKTLEVLRGLETRGATALDVAAGPGLFLDLCVPELFDAGSVMATEYNEKQLRRLRSKGYKALSADLRTRELEAHRGAIDFIFLFQVIEHLDDIDSLFGRLAELSKPGGLIFIAVPNIGWIRHREETGSLKDLPPTHIGRWTPKAFRAVASRHGLVVTDHQVEPFSIANFVRDDLIFSHFARAHRRGTVANRARSLQSRGRRLFAETAEAITFAPMRLRPMWVGIRQGERMGGAALWVQIEKRSG